MTEINIVGRCSFWGSSFRGGLMKYSLLGGAIAGASKGVSNCWSGCKNYRFLRMITGTIQLSLGIASAVYIMTLDSRTVAVAHEFLLLSLLSCYSAYMGVKDVTNKHYLKGASKIILGIGGVAGSVYYAYYQLRYPNEVLIFLENHSSEIKKRYIEPWRNPLSGWERLGKGASKVAYSHSELPNYVIKIPLSKYSWKGDENDVVVHYRNAQIARKIVEENHYSHIRIPDSILITISPGPVLFEERLYFTDGDWRRSPEKKIALMEFHNFQRKAHLCDINPEYGHNAGFLSPLGDKIGIIDFDCKSSE